MEVKNDETEGVNVNEKSTTVKNESTPCDG